MQSLNTLALVKGTFFCVSVLFDLSPKNNKNKNNKKNNNNNKVKCKLTLRVSKKELEKPLNDRANETCRLRPNGARSDHDN